MLKLVEDLVLTDSFLVKGRIDAKYSRLSKVLDDYRKQFLPIADATLIDLSSHDRIETPLVYINVKEVIFAHELVDSLGDVYHKQITPEREKHYIRAFYSGRINLEMSGMVLPGSYEPTSSSHQFFVMTEPTLRGLKLKGNEELQILKRLSYIIIRRDRLSYIYDFRETVAPRGSDPTPGESSSSGE